MTTGERLREIEILHTLAIRALEAAAQLKVEQNMEQSKTASLPDEVLVSIFHRTLRKRGRAVADLRRLAQVCHRWYRIVVTWPTLWSNIQDKDVHYELALKKSLKAPLHIEFESRLVAEDFFGRLEGERARWKSVSFHGEGPYEWETASRSIHGPALESLVLANPWLPLENSTWCPPLIELRTSPRLHHLETYFIDFRFIVGRRQSLPRLNTLVIHGFLNSPAMYRTIWGLLRNSYSLQTIHIEPLQTTLSISAAHGVDQWVQEIVASGSGAMDDIFPEICIPNLQDLKFQYLPSHLCEHLLNRIQADGEGEFRYLTRLTLNTRVPTSGTLEIFSAGSTHPLALALRRICKSVDRLWLVMGDFDDVGVSCTSYPTPRMLEATLERDSQPTQSEWWCEIRFDLEIVDGMPVLSIFDFPGIPPITMSMGLHEELGRSDLQAVTCSIARATPTVDQIALQWHVPQILELLARPDVGWLWPNLKSIEYMKWDSGRSMLIQITKRRKGLLVFRWLGCEYCMR